MYLFQFIYKHGALECIAIFSWHIWIIMLRKIWKKYIFFNLFINMTHFFITWHTFFITWHIWMPHFFITWYTWMYSYTFEAFYSYIYNSTSLLNYVDKIYIKGTYLFPFIYKHGTLECHTWIAALSSTLECRRYNSTAHLPYDDK